MNQDVAPGTIGCNCEQQYSQARDKMSLFIVLLASRNDGLLTTVTKFCMGMNCCCVEYTNSPQNEAVSWAFKCGQRTVAKARAAIDSRPGQDSHS